MKYLLAAALIFLFTFGFVYAASYGDYREVVRGRFSDPKILRWVDSENGVVCYVSHYNGSTGISCLQTRP